MRLTFFWLFILFSMPAFPDQKGWEKVLDKEGITAYTRHIEGSQFKEFRGEMVVDAPVESLIKVINDVESAPRWQYKTEETRLISKNGNTVIYYYVAQTPVFLKKRVSYQKSELFVDSVSGEATIVIENIPPPEPIPDKFVEIPLTKGFWKLTPLEKGKVKVVLQMLAEPGGMIPAWLANLVVVETPYVTLSGLRKIVNKPMYRNVSP
ncbi:MAG: hypothetical protein K9H26_01130 [Prolixibacteraceae bacterium]|nr:hypothetical protein [Prolixibacteraceae bacterium]